MLGYVSINGVVEKADDAKVSVFDRNYLYGDGIIEVLLGVNGEVLACDAHIERLYRSAAEVRLKLPWPKKEIRQELFSLVKMFPRRKCYLRLSVSSGLGIGIARRKCLPQKTIICLPLEFHSYHSDGISLQTVERQKTICAAKTPNYLESIVTIAAANLSGYDDVLWVNSRQQVTEASTANIFFVFNDKGRTVCHTPADHCGLLPGITRQTATDIFTAHGIEVIKCVILKDKVNNYCGSFLSSSIRGLQRVARIDSYSYPADNPHLQKIINLWHEHSSHCSSVESELRAD